MEKHIVFTIYTYNRLIKSRVWFFFCKSKLLLPFKLKSGRKVLGMMIVRERYLVQEEETGVGPGIEGVGGD
jgi:hypothetical protein